MRIITLNANGIRSAGSKGLFGWLAKQQPDVVCVQETKAQEDQLGDALYRPKGYHCYYFDALKKSCPDLTEAEFKELNARLDEHCKARKTELDERKKVPKK